MRDEMPLSERRGPFGPSRRAKKGGEIGGPIRLDEDIDIGGHVVRPETVMVRDGTFDEHHPDATGGGHCFNEGMGQGRTGR